MHKVTRTKLTGGVTQVVEHLLCKHKSLSSNSSPPKIIIKIRTEINEIENTEKSVKPKTGSLKRNQ
jgi:hypothetical protein